MSNASGKPQHDILRFDSSLEKPSDSCLRMTCRAINRLSVKKPGPGAPKLGNNPTEDMARYRSVLRNQLKDEWEERFGEEWIEWKKLRNEQTVDRIDARERARPAVQQVSQASSTSEKSYTVADAGPSLFPQKRLSKDREYGAAYRPVKGKKALPKLIVS